MSYNFRVHIHMGAHKTASTFIQNWLATHQPFLKEHAIAYVPLEKLRQRFTEGFWRLLGADADSKINDPASLKAILFNEATALGYDLDKTRLFVVSEENLLGLPPSLYNDCEFYPDLKQRVQLLSRLFEGHELQTFLAVRSYSEFYPSAYAEMLRQGQIMDFDAYLDKLDMAGNSWVNTVNDIKAVLGDVKVWPYERFKGNAHHVLSALLQTPVGIDKINKTAQIRKSLSEKGLAITMSCRNLLTDNEIKQLANLLANHMEFDKPNERIAIKNRKIVELLNDKYQRDLEKLAPNLIQLEASR